MIHFASPPSAPPIPPALNQSMLGAVGCHWDPQCKTGTKLYYIILKKIPMALQMNPCISVSPLIFYYYCSVYGARTKTWSVIEYIICQPRKPRSCYSISFILAKWLKKACSPCRYFMLYMWYDLLYIDENKGNNSVLLSTFYSSCTNALTLNCILLCSDPDTACFSTTELVGSG